MSIVPENISYSVPLQPSSLNVKNNIGLINPQPVPLQTPSLNVKNNIGLINSRPASPPSTPNTVGRNILPNSNSAIMNITPLPKITPMLTQTPSSNVINNTQIMSRKDEPVMGVPKSPNIMSTTVERKMSPVRKILDTDMIDYNNLIKNNSVDMVLENHGYTVLNKFIITNGKSPVGQYVKALDKNGHKVYIYIDDAKFLNNSNDIVLNPLDKSKENNVPYSVKAGAFDMAGLEVNGIVFETPTSIHFVMRNDNFGPKESVYGFDITKAVDGTILAYPIIRLSEIKSSPADVLDSVSTVTHRIRKREYANTTQELDKMKLAVSQFNQVFDEFNLLSTEVGNNLRERLEELEEYSETYNMSPPVTDEGKERYELFKYNREKKNENMEVLMAINAKIITLRPEVKALTGKIREVIEYTKKELADVNKVIVRNSRDQLLVEQN